MVLRHRQHERFLEQRFHMQLVAVDRQGEEAGIELAFAQQPQHVFGFFLDQQQFQFRETLAHAGDHMRQQVRAQGGENAQPQRARFRVAGALCDRLDLLHLGQHGAGAAGDLAAGFGQQDLAWRAFDQGHATSEYLAASWLDQAWHLLGAGDEPGDVAAFEKTALADIGLLNPVVPTRYSSTYFAHVFSGGYSAGYYSYIWSEVLDADTVEWFRENGGLTRANGDRFRDLLLGVGGSKDPLAAYRDFRGRDAEIEPLLKRRGLDS